ncbi:TonB-dependent siderophore receptor [Nostoc sp. PA-18-2419]|uniref:TonB-dependent siderophore receptor n=1 Tax=Nostoc sp. PA-18-2419 TaxID=2575443 RepID=UPI0011090DF7|nr:TonB-dependent siderophore receptor [Nostoc sp. PA-18-2419]
MKSWQLNIYLLALTLVGTITTLLTQRVAAQVKIENNTQQASVLKQGSGHRKIRQLSELKIPLTSAEYLLVQSPTLTNPPYVAASPEEKQRDVVPITGVKANSTSQGVEVILETPLGTQLQVTNRSAGSNFIADVSGGQLRLPNGDAFTFRSDKPLAGITEITVINIDANTVRVTVVGEKALPKVELFDDNAGLVFGITSAAIATSPPQQPQQQQPASQTPSAQADEPIELVVTGEQDGYRVPVASVGTRTDTPLRDIPQSIQVIPQQVLRDQNVNNVVEALRNVTGAGFANTGRSLFESSVLLRGFNSGDNVLRNGLSESSGGVLGFDAAGIERIEVLKGPASVLYGQAAPGGSVNYVTKQPLSQPYYAVEASAGSFNFYRGAIDLSGPLNISKTVLYRLNLAAQTTESFFDFFEGQQYFVAPTLSWQISDRTKLTLAFEYLAKPQSSDQSYGLPAIGTVLPNPNGKIPRNRYVGEPDDTESLYTTRVGYDLEHRFSDNWQIRNAFRFLQIQAPRRFTYGTALASDNRTLSREFGGGARSGKSRSFNSDTYVVGQFSTGRIRHQLITGINFTRQEFPFIGFNREASPIDLFNPIYGQPLGDVTFEYDIVDKTDALGIYIQDQITLAENLKLLLGGRFDLFRQTEEDRLADTETKQSGNAFSPRVGIVYQPIQPISLYASYSRSFTPTLGIGFRGDAFQPERGTQYEVGVKADLNSRLAATLALYDLTRSNVLTDDPDNPGFSIQTGEQKSRGIELTFQGEILPGWNIITGYAYTDAKVTEDNTLPVGLRFRAVPENTFNLWTSYEFQRGSLQGFGAGVGLFFVGERQGDTLNTFQLPSYLRTDAAIFYKRNRFRAALNFRNLFDVDYFETSFNRYRVFYGDPLTVQGTISFEF